MSNRTGRSGSRGAGSSGSGRASGARGGGRSGWDDAEYSGSGYGGRDDGFDGPPPRRPGASRRDDYDRGNERGYGEYDERDDFGGRGGAAQNWVPGNPGGSYAGSAGRPGYARPAAGPYARYGAASQEPRRKSRPVLITVLLLLLVGLVGSAALFLVLSRGGTHTNGPVADDGPFATYTPGATPTVADTFKAFASDRAKYYIVYPAGWSETSDQKTTQQQYDYIDTFALQNAPSRLLVEQAGAFSTYTDQEIINNEVSNAQRTGVTFSETPPEVSPTAGSTPTSAATGTPSIAPTTQTIGGGPWLRREYAVTNNETPLHMVILATHRAGRGYVIVMVSAAGAFGNDNQAVFDPMLKSFRFVS
jgi:hypothetical protein